MRIRIDRIYGFFYPAVLDKYEVTARCYVNGRFSFKRLFFNTKSQAESVSEGQWIDY